MAVKHSTSHHHGSNVHTHPVPSVEKSPTPKEKMVIRLERYVQHNLEHAELLERLAAEAERWQDFVTARLIRTAEDNIFLQNQPLEKAVMFLKSDKKRKRPEKGPPSIPETPPDPASRRKCASGKERKKC